MTIWPGSVRSDDIFWCRECVSLTLVYRYMCFSWFWWWIPLKTMFFCRLNLLRCVVLWLFLSLYGYVLKSSAVDLLSIVRSLLSLSLSLRCHRAAPVVSSAGMSPDGSAVIFGSLDGNVTCVSATTGKLMWTVETWGPVRCPPTFSANGLVFIGVTRIMWCSSSRPFIIVQGHNRLYLL